MQANPSIFKAYDIRGVVGQTIDEAFAEHLGRAFGSEAVDLQTQSLQQARELDPQYDDSKVCPARGSKANSPPPARRCTPVG